eukprot:4302858-Pyramimonas_sp.AAC.1
MAARAVSRAKLTEPVAHPPQPVARATTTWPKGTITGGVRTDVADSCDDPRADGVLVSGAAGGAAGGGVRAGGADHYGGEAATGGGAGGAGGRLWAGGHRRHRRPHQQLLLLRGAPASPPSPSSRHNIVITSSQRLHNNSSTTFYGSSCANKGALNTPENIVVTLSQHHRNGIMPSRHRAVMPL